MTDRFYVQVINAPRFEDRCARTGFQLAYTSYTDTVRLGVPVRLQPVTVAIWFADHAGLSVPGRRRVSGALESALTAILAVHGDDLDRVLIRGNGDLHPVMKIHCLHV